MLGEIRELHNSCCGRHSLGPRQFDFAATRYAITFPMQSERMAGLCRLRKWEDRGA